MPLDNINDPFRNEEEQPEIKAAPPPSPQPQPEPDVQPAPAHENDAGGIGMPEVSKEQQANFYLDQLREMQGPTFTPASELDPNLVEGQAEYHKMMQDRIAANRDLSSDPYEAPGIYDPKNVDYGMGHDEEVRQRAQQIDQIKAQVRFARAHGQEIASDEWGTDADIDGFLGSHDARHDFTEQGVADVADFAQYVQQKYDAAKEGMSRWEGVLNVAKNTLNATAIGEGWIETAKTLDWMAGGLSDEDFTDYLLDKMDRDSADRIAAPGKVEGFGDVKNGWDALALIGNVFAEQSSILAESMIVAGISSWTAGAAGAAWAESRAAAKAAADLAVKAEMKRMAAKIAKKEATKEVEEAAKKAGLGIAKNMARREAVAATRAAADAAAKTEARKAFARNLGALVVDYQFNLASTAEQRMSEAQARGETEIDRDAVFGQAAGRTFADYFGPIRKFAAKGFSTGTSLQQLAREGVMTNARTFWGGMASAGLRFLKEAAGAGLSFEGETLSDRITNKVVNDTFLLNGETDWTDAVANDLETFGKGAIMSGLGIRDMSRRAMAEVQLNRAVDAFANTKGDAFDAAFSKSRMQRDALANPGFRNLDLAGQRAILQLSHLKAQLNLQMSLQKTARNEAQTSSASTKATKLSHQINELVNGLSPEASKWLAAYESCYSKRNTSVEAFKERVKSDPNTAAKLGSEYKPDMAGISEVAQAVSDMVGGEASYDNIREACIDDNGKPNDGLVIEAGNVNLRIQTDETGNLTISVARTDGGIMADNFITEFNVADFAEEGEDLSNPNTIYRALQAATGAAQTLSSWAKWADQQTLGEAQAFAERIVAGTGRKVMFVRTAEDMKKSGLVNERGYVGEEKVLGDLPNGLSSTWRAFTSGRDGTIYVRADAFKSNAELAAIIDHETFHSRVLELVANREGEAGAKRVADEFKRITGQELTEENFKLAMLATILGVDLNADTFLGKTAEAIAKDLNVLEEKHAYDSEGMVPREQRVPMLQKLMRKLPILKNYLSDYIAGELGRWPEGQEEIADYLFTVMSRTENKGGVALIGVQSVEAKAAEAEARSKQEKQAGKKGEGDGGEGAASSEGTGTGDGGGEGTGAPARTLPTGEKGSSISASEKTNQAIGDLLAQSIEDGSFKTKDKALFQRVRAFLESVGVKMSDAKEDGGVYSVNVDAADAANALVYLLAGRGGEAAVSEAVNTIFDFADSIGKDVLVDEDGNITGLVDKNKTTDEARPEGENESSPTTSEPPAKPSEPTTPEPAPAEPPKKTFKNPNNAQKAEAKANKERVAAAADAINKALDERERAFKKSLLKRGSATKLAEGTMKSENGPRAPAKAKPTAIELGEMPQPRGEGSPLARGPEPTPQNARVPRSLKRVSMTDLGPVGDGSPLAKVDMAQKKTESSPRAEREADLGMKIADDLSLEDLDAYNKMMFDAGEDVHAFDDPESAASQSVRDVEDGETAVLSWDSLETEARIAAEVMRDIFFDSGIEDIENIIGAGTGSVIILQERDGPYTNSSIKRTKVGGEVTDTRNGSGTYRVIKPDFIGMKIGILVADEDGNETGVFDRTVDEIDRLFLKPMRKIDDVRKWIAKRRAEIANGKNAAPAKKTKTRTDANGKRTLLKQPRSVKEISAELEKASDSFYAEHVMDDGLFYDDQIRDGGRVDWSEVPEGDRPEIVNGWRFHKMDAIYGDGSSSGWVVTLDEQWKPFKKKMAALEKELAEAKKRESEEDSNVPQPVAPAAPAPAAPAQQSANVPQAVEQNQRVKNAAAGQELMTAIQTMNGRLHDWVNGDGNSSFPLRVDIENRGAFEFRKEIGDILAKMDADDARAVVAAMDAEIAELNKKTLRKKKAKDLRNYRKDAAGIVRELAQKRADEANVPQPVEQTAPAPAPEQSVPAAKQRVSEAVGKGAEGLVKAASDLSGIDVGEYLVEDYVADTARAKPHKPYTRYVPSEENYRGDMPLHVGVLAGFTSSYQSKLDDDDAKFNAMRSIVNSGIAERIRDDLDAMAQRLDDESAGPLSDLDLGRALALYAWLKDPSKGMDGDFESLMSAASEILDEREMDNWADEILDNTDPDNKSEAFIEAMEGYAERELGVELSEGEARGEAANEEEEAEPIRPKMEFDGRFESLDSKEQGKVLGEVERTALNVVDDFIFAAQPIDAKRKKEASALWSAMAFLPFQSYTMLSEEQQKRVAALVGSFVDNEVPDRNAKPDEKMLELLVDAMYEKLAREQNVDYAKLGRDAVDANDKRMSVFDDGPDASRVRKGIVEDMVFNLISRAAGLKATAHYSRFASVGSLAAARLGIGGLSDAEQMEREGADRTAIWRQTGWWRGKDGQWRVEIPDFELKSAQAVSSALKGGREARLEELIDAPELFAAYPALRSVGVDISEYPSASAATTTQGKGTADADRYDHISVSKKVNDVARFRSILAHEIQHIIQGREGFSMGGDVNFVYMPGTEVGTAAFSELAKRRKDIRTPMSREEYRKAAGFNESDLATKDFEDSYKGYVRSLKNIPWNIDVALQETVARDIYHRIAGEVEARNTQRRLDMTPEERAATPPWETEDVADEKQIVSFASDESLRAAEREAMFLDGKHVFHATGIENVEGIVKHGLRRGSNVSYDENGQAFDAEGGPILVFNLDGSDVQHKGYQYDGITNAPNVRPVAILRNTSSLLPSVEEAKRKVEETSAALADAIYNVLKPELDRLGITEDEFYESRYDLRYKYRDDARFVAAYKNVEDAFSAESAAVDTQIRAEKRADSGKPQIDLSKFGLPVIDIRYEFDEQKQTDIPHVVGFDTSKAANTSASRPSGVQKSADVNYPDAGSEIASARFASLESLRAAHVSLDDALAALAESGDIRALRMNRNLEYQESRAGIRSLLQYLKQDFKPSEIVATLRRRFNAGSAVERILVQNGILPRTRTKRVYNGWTLGGDISASEVASFDSAMRKIKFPGTDSIEFVRAVRDASGVDLNRDVLTRENLVDVTSALKRDADANVKRLLDNALNLTPSELKELDESLRDQERLRLLLDRLTGADKDASRERRELTIRGREADRIADRQANDIVAERIRETRESDNERTSVLHKHSAERTKRDKAISAAVNASRLNSGNRGVGAPGTTSKENETIATQLMNVAWSGGDSLLTAISKGRGDRALKCTKSCIQLVEQSDYPASAKMAIVQRVARTFADAFPAMADSIDPTSNRKPTMKNPLKPAEVLAWNGTTMTEEFVMANLSNGTMPLVDILSYGPVGDMAAYVRAPAAIDSLLRAVEQVEWRGDLQPSDAAALRERGIALREMLDRAVFGRARDAYNDAFMDRVLDGIRKRLAEVYPVRDFSGESMDGVAGIDARSVRDRTGTNADSADSATISNAELTDSAKFDTGDAMEDSRTTNMVVNDVDDTGDNTVLEEDKTQDVGTGLMRDAEWAEFSPDDVAEDAGFSRDRFASEDTARIAAELEEKYPLMAVHGLSLGSLQKALDNGAFVMPSIAVRRHGNTWRQPGYVDGNMAPEEQVFVLFGRDTIDNSSLYKGDGSIEYASDAATPTVSVMQLMGLKDFSQSSIDYARKRWEDEHGIYSQKTSIEDARKVIYAARGNNISKEAKPWRRVPFSEAAAVLIDNSAPNDVERRLRDNGVENVVRINMADPNALADAQSTFAPRFASDASALLADENVVSAALAGLRVKNADGSFSYLTRMLDFLNFEQVGRDDPSFRFFDQRTNYAQVWEEAKAALQNDPGAAEAAEEMALNAYATEQATGARQRFQVSTKQLALQRARLLIRAREAKEATDAVFDAEAKGVGDLADLRQKMVDAEARLSRSVHAMAMMSSSAGTALGFLSRMVNEDLSLVESMRLADIRIAKERGVENRGPLTAEEIERLKSVDRKYEKVCKERDALAKELAAKNGEAVVGAKLDEAVRDAKKRKASGKKRKTVAEAVEAARKKARKFVDEGGEINLAVYPLLWAALNDGVKGIASAIVDEQLDSGKSLMKLDHAAFFNRLHAECRKAFPADMFVSKDPTHQELTEKDCRNLFADYGDPESLLASESEAAADAARLRAAEKRLKEIAEIESAIEDIKAGRPPLEAYGHLRDRSATELDAELERLRKERDDALRESGLSSKLLHREMTPLDLAKEHIENRIEDIRNTIGEYDEAKAQGPEKLVSFLKKNREGKEGRPAIKGEESLAALRDEMHFLENARDALMKNRGLTDNERMQMIEEMFRKREKSASDALKRLRAGEKPVKPLDMSDDGLRTAWAHADAEFRARAAEARRAASEASRNLAAIKRAMQTESYRFEKALESALARKEDAIIRWRDALDSGRVTIRAVENTQAKRAIHYDERMVALDREMKTLIQERNDKVAQIAYDRKKKSAKILSTIWQMTNLQRIVQASGDLSSIGVQCASAVLANPIDGLRAIAPGIKAFWGAMCNKPEYTEQFFETMRKDKDFALIADYVAIPETDGKGGFLQSGTEEFFKRKAIQDRFPKLLGINPFDNRYLRASEAGFNVPVALIRFSLAKRLLAQLRSLRGENYMPTEQEMTLLGNVVNAATGKGKWLADGSKVNLSGILWAASRVSGQIESLALPARLLAAGMDDVSGDFRRKIAGELMVKPFLHFGAAMLLLGLCHALFKDEDDDDPFLEIDPRSSKFLRAKIGNRYMSLTGGLEQYAVLLAKGITGFKKTSGGNTVSLRGGDFGQSFSQELWRMVKNKLRPDLGLILNLADMKDGTGKTIKPQLLEKGGRLDFFVKNTYYPLTMRDIVEAVQDSGENGAPLTAMLAAIAVLGYNGSDFGETRYRKDKARVDTAAQAKRDSDNGMEGAQERYADMVSRPENQRYIAAAKSKKLKKISDRITELDGMIERGEPQRAKKNGPITSRRPLSREERKAAEAEMENLEAQYHEALWPELTRLR